MKMTSESINWSYEETDFFISLIAEKNIVGQLDGKKFRNADIYRTLEKPMANAGFPRKMEQLRTKWKRLQACYRKSLSTTGSGRQSCPHFDMLHDILGTRSSFAFVGVDSSDTITFVTNGVDMEEGKYEIPIELPNVPRRMSPGVESDCTNSSSSTDSVPSASPNASSDSLSRTQASETTRKAGSDYTDAVAKFTEKWTEAQERNERLFERQQEIWQREFAAQRRWEEEQMAAALEMQQRIMTEGMTQFTNCIAMLVNAIRPPSQCPPGQSSRAEQNNDPPKE